MGRLLVLSDLPIIAGRSSDTPMPLKKLVDPNIDIASTTSALADTLD
jgi:hypothetical protein